MVNVIINVRGNAAFYLVIIAKNQCVCNVPVVMSSHIIKIPSWSFAEVVKKPWRKNLFFVASKENGNFVVYFFFEKDRTAKHLVKIFAFQIFACYFIDSNI